MPWRLLPRREEKNGGRETATLCPRASSPRADLLTSFLARASVDAAHPLVGGPRIWGSPESARFAFWAFPGGVGG